MINARTTREVGQLLFRKARLFDEQRFHDWLDLLSDPTRTRQAYTGAVARLETGMAWAEAPPLRTRHFMTPFSMTL